MQSDAHHMYPQPSFSTLLFKALNVKVKANDKRVTVPTTFKLDGKTYELLSYKVNQRKNFRYVREPAVIVYKYILTKENGKQIINLQQELEKLCSFGSLSRQKVIARLSHLQSEIKFMIDVKCTDVEIIDENGHEGCGFVPPSKSIMEFIAFTCLR